MINVFMGALHIQFANRLKQNHSQLFVEVETKGQEKSNRKKAKKLWMIEREKIWDNHVSTLMLAAIQ